MTVANYYIGMFLVMISLLIETGYSIKCYQCNSVDNKYPFQCTEFLTSDVDLKPEPCDDVYGAQYCIKHVGRFEAMTLDCYQCTVADLGCGDGDIVKSDFVATNCNHVYDARYCIKTINYAGGMGTTRFCSSVDMGTYCDYVKHPGDTLTYRACVFTCTGDGCNPATFFMPNAVFTWIMPMGLLVAWKKLFHR